MTIPHRYFQFIFVPDLTKNVLKPFWWYIISSTAESKAGRGRESMICQIRPDFSKLNFCFLPQCSALCTHFLKFLESLWLLLLLDIGLNYMDSIPAVFSSVHGSYTLTLSIISISISASMHCDRAGEVDETL